MKKSFNQPTRHLITKFFLPIISIIGLFMIFGWNYSNPDYNNYLQMYLRISDFHATNSTGFLLERKDYGFMFLMNLSVLLNLNYQQFVIFISFFGLALIYSTIILFSSNPTSVIFLYFLFPFLIDVVQIRNFLMASLIIYSYRYLVFKSPMNFIKFLTFLVISFFIHSTSILYFVFIFVYFKPKFLSFIPIIFFASIAIFIIFNNFNIQFIIDFLSLFTNNDLFFYWFQETARIGFLAQWAFLFALNIIFFFFTKRIFSKNLFNIKIKDRLFLDTTRDVLFLTFSFLPFLIINVEFFRLVRNLFILFYIAFMILLNYSKVYFVSKKKHNKTFLTGLTTLIFFSTFFVIFTWELYLPHLYKVVLEVLINNLLW